MSCSRNSAFPLGSSSTTTIGESLKESISSTTVTEGDVHAQDRNHHREHAREPKVTRRREVVLDSARKRSDAECEPFDIEDFEQVLAWGGALKQLR